MISEAARHPPGPARRWERREGRLRNCDVFVFDIFLSQLHQQDPKIFSSFGVDGVGIDGPPGFWNWYQFGDSMEMSRYLRGRCHFRAVEPVVWWARWGGFIHKNLGML